MMWANKAAWFVGRMAVWPEPVGAVINFLQAGLKILNCLMKVIDYGELALYGQWFGGV
jgi:hypothetical protein